MTGLELRRPGPAELPAYEAALRRGFSPDNVTPEATARRELAAIAADPAAFLAAQDDPEGRGPPVILPDGRAVPRLPGFRRWAWGDGAFLGSFGFRWQPGTAELPPHVLGHIGYVTVAWRRGEGVATRALALLLAEVAPLGLPWVELTTEPDNHASIRVIERNGGRPLGAFTTHAAYGGGEKLRFRIPLAEA